MPDAPEPFLFSADGAGPPADVEPPAGGPLTAAEPLSDPDPLAAADAVPLEDGVTGASAESTESAGGPAAARPLSSVESEPGSE
ncbi:hypothetical protein [Nocardiopsis gilva]|uniref:hypothetical protein n=1 Tax=Nocardiopsis gilva TaxID=280236 RepID=UPI0012FE0113|nr:hypothetical protein [Nocardiopsis gilva]